MALITPLLAGATARDVVAASLTPATATCWHRLLRPAAPRGRRTMLVLFVLLAQIVIEAWPVIENQGARSSPARSAPIRRRSACGPALRLDRIGLGVVLVTIPLGVPPASTWRIPPL